MVRRIGSPISKKAHTFAKASNEGLKSARGFHVGSLHKRTTNELVALGCISCAEGLQAHVR